jgi:hypothetical protein
MVNHSQRVLAVFYVCNSEAGHLGALLLPLNLSPQMQGLTLQVDFLKIIINFFL